MRTHAHARMRRIYLYIIYKMLVSRRLFYTLFGLAILLIIIFVYKRATAAAAPPREGFTQSTPFVLKREQNVYDDFYSAIYDDLFANDEKTRYIIQGIIDITNPSPDHSIFLEIGSGTGRNVRALHEQQYSAFGVEKSRAMMKIADKTCGCVKGYSNDADQEIIKHGDVLDPMLYDHNLFTHILVLDETLVEFKDKHTLIRNLRTWLRRNGYLIIHVVSHEKYGAGAGATEKDLRGVQYNSVYSRAPRGGDAREITFRETMVDKKTSYVRQNEKTLYVEPIADLVRLIKQEGFIVHGIVDLKPVTKDNYQYLYIFEKT